MFALRRVPGALKASCFTTRASTRVVCSTVNFSRLPPRSHFLSTTNQDTQISTTSTDVDKPSADTDVQTPTTDANVQASIPADVQTPTTETDVEPQNSSTKFEAPGPVKFEIVKGKVTVGSQKIPDFWLRDNCQCQSCVHDATKQRLLDTFSIPKNIQMKEHAIDADNVNIKWSDGHESVYPRTFLNRIAATPLERTDLRRGSTKVKFWDASIAEDPPRVLFDDENRTGNLLHKIREYGFCYVDNVPHSDPSATEELLRSIAFIRETHYGGFYDFTADLASKDTAYTNIALEAHTDTTYFSDPAGLQAFHLLSHTDGEGGASLLVDGFKAAAELRKTHPEAYRTLFKVRVHAHASGNDGISIQPYRGFPVIEKDPSTGEVLRVRWNNADRASIDMPIEKVQKWYDAARIFNWLLKKRESEYWEQLKPGRVLIFDNWRVLHGRSAFTGKRRICGGYINRDDWISKYKMEQHGRDAVLGNLAFG